MNSKNPKITPLPKFGSDNKIQQLGVGPVVSDQQLKRLMIAVIVGDMMNGKRFHKNETSEIISQALGCVDEIFDRT